VVFPKNKAAEIEMIAAPWTPRLIWLNIIEG
jgi:hypothetical protein